MNSIVIETQSKAVSGKKVSNDLRKEDWIPCNIYGGKENISFSASLKSLRPLVYTPDFSIASITLDGAEHRAIIKELQFDPVTDKLKHIDFLELVEGKIITIDVPLRLTGSPAGVRAGGKLYQKVRSLNIRTKPEHLIGSLDVDVTNLELGKTIRVGDLKYNNIEILTNGSIPVAAVSIPRVVVEEPKAVAAAAPVAGAATPGAPGAAPAAAAKPDAKEKKK